MKTVRQLTKPQITEIIRRMGERAKKNRVLSPGSDMRFLMVFGNLCARYEFAPMPSFLCWLFGCGK